MAATQFPNNSNTSVLLFDEQSVGPKSLMFYVPPGGGVMLKAWGISKPEYDPEDKRPVKSPHAYIEMILAEPQEIPTVAGGTCDGPADINDLLPVPVTAAIACVKQCGLWSLYDNQNVAIIAIPGMYRVVLSDPAVVGNVYVEATRLRSEDLRHIPDDLMFGKLSKG